MAGQPRGDKKGDKNISYKEGAYRPLDEGFLQPAPDNIYFPDKGNGPDFKQYDDLPEVPPLSYIVGPAVIALGMGLGAGEFLLWPNLFATGGFSIWWLFVVGVLTQFVVISEIERWTIATGESIFSGMARLDKYAFWSWFFLAATLISFFWPGWASQSAVFVSYVIEALGGASYAWQPIALVMIVIIYVALAGSAIVYNALEKFEILLIALFFPLLIITLVLVGISWPDVAAIFTGMVSVGSVPASYIGGEQFPTFLIAVAYAGSGGTLLLVQSLYIRDKGFGMGIYQGRIAGLRGTNEEISKTGYAFDSGNPKLTGRFKAWMKLAQNELLLVFVVLIILSVLITSLIIAATIGTNNPALAGDLVGTVLLQAEVIKAMAGPIISIAFLLGGALVLFSTQVAIMDTVTRITGDIFHARYGHRNSFWSLKRTFLLFLTVLFIVSCAIILASWLGGKSLANLQPNFLVIIAGPFTIASMYIFTLVVAYMNTRRLPKAIAMPAWKRAGMVWAAALWGWFTAEILSRVIMSQVLRMTGPAVDTITFTTVRIILYGIWVLSLIWLVWVVSGNRKEPESSKNV